ncbi:MAG: hypothetical protein ACTHJ4_08545 [Candidatus Nucleicultricaceae bacterium]|jgi:hypothetical protein
MNKNIISPILSIFVLTALASYPVNAGGLDTDEEAKVDLKRRQNIVDKQLEEHQRLNRMLNIPQPTLYGAIQEVQKEDWENDFYDNLYASQKYGVKFGSVYTPSMLTTPEVMSLLDLNKQANDAKHKW